MAEIKTTISTEARFDSEAIEQALKVAVSAPPDAVVHIYPDSNGATTALCEATVTWRQDDD